MPLGLLQIPCACAHGKKLIPIFVYLGLAFIHGAHPAITVVHLYHADELAYPDDVLTIGHRG
jgi:hypothetical protein